MLSYLSLGLLIAEDKRSAVIDQANKCRTTGSVTLETSVLQTASNLECRDSVNAIRHLNGDSCALLGSSKERSLGGSTCWSLVLAHMQAHVVD